MAHSVIFITKKVQTIYMLTLNAICKFTTSKLFKKYTYCIYLHSSLSNWCEGIVQGLYLPCAFVHLAVHPCLLYVLNNQLVKVSVSLISMGRYSK